MSSSAALIKLRDGRTYAAASHEFHDGWLSIIGARYWKVGQEGQERTRFGKPQAFSWPRTAVEEVRAAAPLAQPQRALSEPVAVL